MTDAPAHERRPLTKDEAACPDLWHFCSENFNKPILCNETVVRCIGYGEDGRDCYVIVSSMREGVFWQTGVGGYISLARLEGQGVVIAHNGEIWDDLTRLDDILRFNGAPYVEQFEAWFDGEERPEQATQFSEEPAP